jgi:hypothetical protein
MSGRVKRSPRGPQVDMASRALREYEEAQRRAYHEDIRRDLIERGALVDTTPVEELLKDAAPRLRNRGWRITERKEK